MEMVAVEMEDGEGMGQEGRKEREMEGGRVRGRSEEYNAIKPTVPFYSGRLLNLLEESIKGVNGQNKKTKLQSGGI